ncbi:MAG TPA: DUF721 domain-containing protein [bacterium]|nr:DUF721 domain-containing protein [bacterium]
MGEESDGLLRVGDVLRGLESGNHLGRRLAESRALEAWPQIVGRPLAERTRPLRLAAGRLFVAAPGSALRQELVFHKAMIMQRLNQFSGMVAVREIVFLEGDEEHHPGERAAGTGQETSWPT